VGEDARARGAGFGGFYCEGDFWLQIAMVFAFDMLCCSFSEFIYNMLKTAESWCIMKIEHFDGGCSMNLLVIGNGFDRAHDLKTNYLDFLGWAYDNEHMGSSYGKHIRAGIEDMRMNVSFDLSLYWRYVSIQNYDVTYGANYQGTYFPPFSKMLFKEQKSWIDLENNLAACLEMLRSEGDFGVLNALFTEFLLPKFEQYIADVINKAECEPRLSVAGTDLVLSFNYSNTFERLYGQQSNAKVCYVNGKAQTNAKKSNIVFGCDCSVDSSEKSNPIIDYDKTYQRADKDCCDSYTRWYPKQKGPRLIHIVGHSLGETDWSILHPFVTEESSKTTVYYHNEKSKRELIYNMMRMVGKEFMDQRRPSFRHISELVI